MEKVYIIYDYKSEENYIRLEGRAILHFYKNDDIYIRNKTNNEYEKVSINSIKKYIFEFEELMPIEGAIIYLQFCGEEFSDYDMMLYRKSK